MGHFVINELSIRIDDLGSKDETSDRVVVCSDVVKSKLEVKSPFLKMNLIQTFHWKLVLKLKVQIGCFPQ